MKKAACSTETLVYSDDYRASDPRQPKHVYTPGALYISTVLTA